jgi:hypothetical protein
MSNKKKENTNQRSKKMETTKFAKQSLQFQKTIFENSFNALILAQDQTEKLVGSYLDQLPWVNDESRKALQTSVEMAKKARNDFKNAVEDGYRKFEELLEEK